nr:TonB-dependent receptor plug domain-containing protein [Prevotella corporis]
MPAKKNILYVIDGKEYASGEYDINKLDLNQIESMTVLKGQQAVDKYGDRAKDGAIVFQLKK